MIVEDRNIDILDIMLAKVSKINSKRWLWKVLHGLKEQQKREIEERRLNKLKEKYTQREKFLENIKFGDGESFFMNK